VADYGVLKWTVCSSHYLAWVHTWKSPSCLFYVYALCRGEEWGMFTTTPCWFSDWIAYLWQITFFHRNLCYFGLGTDLINA